MRTTRPLTEDEMRAAVARRDRACGDRFLYGVVTTRIYCRPGCPAPAARPGNLRFFADGEAAAVAGFRPCRRCRPDDPRRLGAVTGPG